MKAAIVALILAVLAALGLPIVTGCSVIQGREPVAPHVERALARLECQLEVVRDLVPVVELADQVVMSARAKDYEAVLILLTGVGYTVDEVRELSRRSEACFEGGGA